MTKPSRYYVRVRTNKELWVFSPFEITDDSRSMSTAGLTRTRGSPSCRSPAVRRPRGARSATTVHVSTPVGRPDRPLDGTASPTVTPQVRTMIADGDSVTLEYAG